MAFRGVSIAFGQEKKRQANRALACGATRKKRRRPWWR